MATPLNNHPEWDPATIDGPAEVAAMARSLEKNTILRFASASARDSAFTAAGVAYGAATKGWVCALDDDAAALYVHDGSADATGWKRHGPDTAMPVFATGMATLTFNNSTGAAAVNVTFPAGRFAAAPAPQATIVSSAGAALGVVPLCYAVTATGMTVTATQATGAAITASIPVAWFAGQEP